MFVDQDASYAQPSNNALIDYLSQVESLNDSFSSMSSYHSNNGSISDASTASWDSSIATPNSTSRRGSFGSIKREEVAISTTAPRTPDRYTANRYCAAPQEVLSGLQDRTMMYAVDNKMSMEQNFSNYNFPSFNTPLCEPYPGSHSLPENPYSPLPGMNPSSVSETFVVPSQVALMEAINTHSPMRSATSSQFFDMTYDGTTDYDTCYSDSPLSSSTRYYVPPSYETLQSSTSLQRIQEQSQSSRNAHAQRLARKRMAKRESRDSMLPGNIRIQKQAEKECAYEGCHRKFQRQEHLKRHEKTHTGTESYQCEFCPKSFGRTDNLKSHMWLHADPEKKPSTRTKHWPQAMKVFNEMSQKPRKRNVSESPQIKMETDSKNSRSRVSKL